VPTFHEIIIGSTPEAPLSELQRYVEVAAAVEDIATAQKTDKANFNINALSYDYRQNFNINVSDNVITLEDE
jgi:hypothetical protein